MEEKLCFWQIEGPSKSCWCLCRSLWDFSFLESASTSCLQCQVQPLTHLQIMVGLLQNTVYLFNEGLCCKVNLRPSYFFAQKWFYKLSAANHNNKLDYLVPEVKSLKVVFLVNFSYLIKQKNETSENFAHFSLQSLMLKYFYVPCLFSSIGPLKIALLSPVIFWERDMFTTPNNCYGMQIFPLNLWLCALLNCASGVAVEGKDNINRGDVTADWSIEMFSSSLPGITALFI